MGDAASELSPMYFGVRDPEVGADMEVALHLAAEEDLRTAAERNVVDVTFQERVVDDSRPHGGTSWASPRATRRPAFCKSTARRALEAGGGLSRRLDLQLHLERPRLHRKRQPALLHSSPAYPMVG